MGLKDQQMALEWVYDNIGNFGGDRDRITVAGGASVSYLLVNEKSSSMINRAIIRHTNFISPYNRPYEVKTDFKPINIATYAKDINKIWKNFADLNRLKEDQILSYLPDWNWTVKSSNLTYFVM